ncbi:MAG: hypothetical protein QNK89_04390 [Lacinutrix sp.]|uniref:hypothetical protein n=1 Tax=Lacinutrix sp. TaxID=1937692 RepID=UPI0030AA37AC
MTSTDRIITARSRQFTERGLTTEKMTVTWRHYISGVSTYTLYDTGSTTTFPFAYGGIPVPYDAYFSQFMFSSMPYSSRQFPNGSSLTLSVYVDNVLKGSQTATYGNNVRETVVLDFFRTVKINKGETVTLRLQVNGQWWYSASTSIIIER